MSVGGKLWLPGRTGRAVGLLVVLAGVPGEGTGMCGSLAWALLVLPAEHLSTCLVDHVSFLISNTLSVFTKTIIIIPVP